MKKLLSFNSIFPLQLQKQEEMNRRKLENQALQREIKAREVEEKRRAEIEEKLKRMQEDMEKRGQELQDALATIQKLQNQLQETQVTFILQQRRFDSNSHKSGIVLLNRDFLIPGEPCRA